MLMLGGYGRPSCWRPPQVSHYDDDDDDDDMLVMDIMVVDQGPEG